MKYDFLDKCDICVHKKEKFTCPASWCKLNHSEPCSACSYIKYKGKFGKKILVYPEKCKDFSEKG